MVADDLERARDAAATCDVLIAAGTSLTVFPVAHLPRIALEARARLAVFNAGSTPFDPVANAVVRTRLATSLPALVELVD